MTKIDTGYKTVDITTKPCSKEGLEFGSTPYLVEKITGLYNKRKENRRRYRYDEDKKFRCYATDGIRERILSKSNVNYSDSQLKDIMGYRSLPEDLMCRMSADNKYYCRNLGHNLFIFDYNKIGDFTVLSQSIVIGANKIKSNAIETVTVNTIAVKYFETCYKNISDMVGLPDVTECDVFILINNRSYWVDIVGTINQQEGYCHE